MQGLRCHAITTYINQASVTCIVNTN